MVVGLVWYHFPAVPNQLLPEHQSVVPSPRKWRYNNKISKMSIFVRLTNTLFISHNLKYKNAAFLFRILKVGVVS